MEPTRSSDYLNLDNNGHLTFKHENDVKDLGNMNIGQNSPSKMVKELGVTRLKLMGVTNRTNEDILTELDIRIPERRLEN